MRAEAHVVRIAIETEATNVCSGMSRPTDSNFHQVTCPSCLQVFEVAGPPPEECPTEWDYDCEVCCRPLVISFEIDGDEVWADARGIND